MDKKTMLEALISHFTDGNKAQFAKHLGVSPQTISAWIARNTFDSELIYPKCRYISPSWLLTGEGDMLSNDAEMSVSMDPQEGTPYYDVDFLGGFDLQENDQTSTPSLNIVTNICPRAEMWCNITGHSMEPKISHGDIIALHKCTIEDIQYGEMYAVVLDTFRTVKVLRKSQTPGMLKFVPLNTVEFDEQEFPVSRIIQIYEVVGSIRRFF